MDSSACAHRLPTAVGFEAEHLPPEEQGRTERLVLTAGRDMPSCRQVREDVAEPVRPMLAVPKAR